VTATGMERRLPTRRGAGGHTNTTQRQCCQGNYAEQYPS
jgi:hypothetical protein